MYKLFVSTPCYGGLCLQGYAESVLGLIKILSKYPIDMMFDIQENESLITRARNVAIGRFLQKTDRDYFMFIDADIKFDPESVVRLVMSGHDVAVAAYPKKGIMWDQVVQGDSRKDPDKLSASLVMNFKLDEKGGCTAKNGFVEVHDGPTGFMMIKRCALEKMYKAYPELNCVNDHQNRDFEYYCAIFDCMIDPESKRYLSEDYAFCRRYQQIGGKIHADISTTLGHIGNLRFQGSLRERLGPLA